MRDFLHDGSYPPGVSGFEWQVNPPDRLTPKKVVRMPRISPHATVWKQDAQLRQQLRWLKAHGFNNAREAQEAGY